MPFLGNTPAESYISFAKQDITGNGGTSYSLNHPVTNAADIELFVNNVQQEPTEAYTASGSTLTLSEAIQSTDECYCIFRGRSLQTVSPPDGSVTSAKLDTSISIAGDLTVDTTTLKVDSTNNLVGIGTASPTAGFRTSIKGDYSSIIGGIEFDSGGGDKFTIGHATATSPSATLNVVGAGNLIMKTNNAERMRITSSGALLVGSTDTNPFNNTSASATSIEAGIMQIAASSSEALYLNRFGSDGRIVNIRKGGSFIGGIDVSTSSVTYASASDYRLKTAVEYDWDATSRLKQLKPARFKWIVDGDDAVPVDGFLAHEVSHDSDGNPLVPEAITGTHNEVDGDGNPEYQGIDQSKLVPLLVKTIQELEARITALEAS